MLVNYLLAIVLVMVLLIAWCSVQNWARNYAHRHPEFGPAREEGGECSVACRCSNPCDDAKCERKKFRE